MRQTNKLTNKETSQASNTPTNKHQQQLHHHHFHLGVLG